MRLGIVVLDVQEVGGLLERWVIPVQIAHPLKAISALLLEEERRLWHRRMDLPCVDMDSPSEYHGCCT